MAVPVVRAVDAPTTNPLHEELEALSINGPARIDKGATLVSYNLNPFESLPTQEIECTTDDVHLRYASKYHIYFRKLEKRHFIITPLESPPREHAFRTPHLLRKKSKTEERDLKDIDVFEGGIPKEAALNTWFVHQPSLAFHRPPRVLRRGASKTSPPICLIENSWLWRKWILQFGDRLADNGVIDRRGVVSEEHTSSKKERGGFALKGYRIRKWRVWGESGKDFLHDVNRQRKEQAGRPSLSDKETTTGSQSGIGECEATDIIDEAVHFSWHSPFTTKPRHYRFKYAGIEFFWKGTGTVKETKKCGFMLHFNHLKLCARVPIPDHGIQPTNRKRFNSAYQYLCLGKYTCVLGARKAGVLELYDQAIYRFLKEYMKQVEVGSDEASVKHTRFYDLIIATAMCMIIGEWQKRKTIRKILETAAAEGGGNA